MEKKIVGMFVLIFWAGAAFAQTSPDSTKTSESPGLLPPLSSPQREGKFGHKFELPRQNKGESFWNRREPQDLAREEVTPFYSNMPMAKFQNKQEPMPSVKADESSTKYHLLKKRYKVLPLPNTPEKPAQ
ncbi:hypothetical protein [Rufibacter latericius]|uniref:Uncharacterized protein n=1 Tax=Rufibacter latericius TaxID=2487040 RepID=A0A3M9N047_9BACT|nr:hypothetical protein [Rufibacter latericius]RNI31144.1 hypothetical protein EFB08_00995 [Rufibacter latericius]